MTGEIPQGVVYEEQAEAEAVKALATVNASKADFLDKPLAIHYESAAKYIDQVGESYGEGAKEVYIEIVNSKEEIFKEVGTDAREVFNSSRKKALSELEDKLGDFYLLLEELSSREGIESKEVLRAEFDKNYRGLIYNFFERVRELCNNSGLFKGKENLLAKLIELDNRLSPVVEIPEMYMGMVKRIMF